MESSSSVPWKNTRLRVAAVFSVTLKQKNRAERGSLLLFLNHLLHCLTLVSFRPCIFVTFILNGLFIPYCHMYSSVSLFVLVLSLLLLLFSITAIILSLSLLHFTSAAPKTTLIFLMRQASRLENERKEKKQTKKRNFKTFQSGSVRCRRLVWACPGWLSGVLIGGRGQDRYSERCQKMTRSHFLSDRPSVRPQPQPGVGRRRHPSTQPGGSTAPHRTLRYPPLPAATSSPARNQEMLRSAPLVSVTVKIVTG